MGDKSVGGGEILQFWGDGSTNKTNNLDTSLIQQFLMLPVVKAIIVALIIVIALLIISKILKVRNPMRGKIITKELEHLDNVKKHDESIIRANRMISSFTSVVEHSPFAFNKSNSDYWAYNLSRANIRIPGGVRLMKPEEFNAIVVSTVALICSISMVIGILFNLTLGFVLFSASIVLGSTLPMIIVRQKVKEKDLEITENFADFYLMIHYVLLASASTPISGIMKSYDKTTDSVEMHRFIDVCIHYIETYGEFEATSYIANQYREIPEIAKLMRLIKQVNEGADIRAELVGFREELLDAKEYAIQKRMEKLVMKAKASFNILMPVLIQAIVSAMAIYLDDLGVASTFIK